MQVLGFRVQGVVRVAGIVHGARRHCLVSSAEIVDPYAWRMQGS